MCLMKQSVLLTEKKVLSGQIHVKVIGSVDDRVGSDSVLIVRVISEYIGPIYNCTVLLCLISVDIHSG